MYLTGNYQRVGRKKKKNTWQYMTFSSAKTRPGRPETVGRRITGGGADAGTGGGAREEFSDCGHSSDLHLQGSYVISGLFQNIRQRKFPAPGDQTAKNANFPLHSWQTFPFQT